MKRKFELKMVAIFLTAVMMLSSVVPVFAENAVSDNTLDITDSTITYEEELNVELIREEIAGKAYDDEHVLVVMKEQAEEMLSDCPQEYKDEAALVAESLEGEAEGIAFAVVDVPQGMDVAEAIAHYSELPGVDFVQPDYIYELEEEPVSEVYLNDPYYNKQSYIQQIGADKAWDMVANRHLNEVLVGVIDTGVDVNHPDLMANLRMDLSVNAYTESMTRVTGDSGSHGTHVTGTIAAINNNGIGVAGLGNNYAKVVPIRCADLDGSMKSSYVVRGIDYAIGSGIQVINMSLGMYTSDSAMEAALQRAYNAGIILICSAGNDGTLDKHYPSAYPSTIGVISVDSNNSKVSSSNYGTDNFISAPGGSIYNTIPFSSYGSKGGTSMASAVTTGAVSFLLAVDNTLSPDQIRSVLAETATDTYSPGFDMYSGYGVINLERAVEKVLEFAQIEVPADVKSPTSVDNFVKRLYYYCLNREPDGVGFYDWKNKLVTGQNNGGEVAGGFLFSSEFIDKNLTDRQYVTILYRVFLGREPDPSGMADWTNRLANGLSRQYVMNGFSCSNEFAAICNRCGFSGGMVQPTEARDMNPGTTAFVARLYTKALGRNYDIPGLNDWCKWINNGEASALDVATNGFFHSQEFLNKRTTNSEFVKILYRTFLGREYDTVGYNDWMNKLRSGVSRDEIIKGFAYSQEFRDIMASYGL